MLILDSDRIEPACRDDALDAAFNGSEVPQRVRYVVPARSVRHRIELFELGPGVHLLRNIGTGIHIVRGPREIRSGAPEQLAICLQAKGTGQLDADGSQYVKKPGDLSLQDTTRPYSYRQADYNDHKVVLIDPALLTLPVDLIRSAAHTLSASPLYPLVQQHFARLGDGSLDLPPEVSARLGRATTQLVAALVTTAVSDSHRQALEDTLLPRITMYVDAHLGDPALDADQTSRSPGGSFVGVLSGPAASSPTLTPARPPSPRSPAATASPTPATSPGGSAKRSRRRRASGVASPATASRPTGARPAGTAARPAGTAGPVS
jgi:hypothetical protein